MKLLKKIGKKKLILIISVLVFLVIIILGLIFYFKPLKISDRVFNDADASIILERRFNQCKIENRINKKDVDKNMASILKDDGYKLQDNVFVKTFKTNGTCDDLKEKYQENKVDFKLNGDSVKEVEVNQEYKDDVFLDNKLKDKVLISNNVDEEKIGEYYVIYTLKKDILNKYLVRKVVVKDTTKPVITLNQNQTITLNVGSKYNEPGYTASDNYDGDITDNVVVESNVDTSKEGEYNVVYKVKDSSGNEFEINRKVVVKAKTNYVSSNVSGLTYINGILIVNKKYGLPKDYNPGVNKEANEALKRMQADASAIGLDLKLVSGFRSYNTQYNLYNNYVRINGQAKADTFSARPGYSEHQTGLAFDVGSTKGSFANTAESKWLEQNCHLYGFIIRYPKGKTSITGYIYEPWHIRYLGVDTATKVKQTGLTLEEYLGIN